MDNSNSKQWCFAPIDTWFFREARPYDSIGGTQLSSIFPPSARTVAGAVRTLIGENTEVDWNDFHQNENHHLRKEIGDSKQLGQLKLVGPYLLNDNQRLYPVPLILLEAHVKKKSEVKKNTNTRIKLKSKNTSTQKQFVRLHPGYKPVNCDLGHVYLPEITALKNKVIENAKTIENVWLTAENLQYILEGEIPHDVEYLSKLVDTENRLGIALNKKTRSVEEHQLYQSQHIRIRYYVNLQVGVTVSGIDETLHPKETGQIRFGGDGRLADVTISTSLPTQLKSPNLTKAKNGIFLTLLTPANLGKSWLPPNFTETDDEKGAKIWNGSIKGVELTIVCAVLGKSIRDGGWDLANNQPRQVISLVPAGSVWFCKVRKGNPADLQGYHIGQETELGRGELAVGIW